MFIADDGNGGHDVINPPQKPPPEPEDENEDDD